MKYSVVVRINIPFSLDSVNHLGGRTYAVEKEAMCGERVVATDATCRKIAHYPTDWPAIRTDVGVPASVWSARIAWVVRVVFRFADGLDLRDEDNQAFGQLDLFVEAVE